MANDADIKDYEDDLPSLRFPNTNGPFRDGAHQYRFDRDSLSHRNRNLVSFLIQLRYRDIHLLIHSDNKAAIGVLSKLRSPNLHLNLCARRTQVLRGDHMIAKKLIYVESRLNPADRPSRGLAFSSLPLHNHLRRHFSLPPDLAELFVPGDW
jgi:hypothetical protein